MTGKIKRKKSIRGKMILSNSILIILVVVAIEVSLSLISIRTLISDSLTYNDQLVQTMSNSFDDMWQSFKWAINTVTMNQEFQAVLSGKNGIHYENGEDNVILRSLTSDSVLLCDEMEKMHIYDKDGRLKLMINKKIRSNEQYTLFPSIQEDWFDKSGKIKSVLVDGKLTFNRIIYDITDRSKIGYIVCVYDQSALENRVSAVVPSPNRFVMVFDKNNNIVVHNCSDPTLLDTMVGTLSASGIGSSGICEIPGIGGALVSQYTSKVTGWRTVSVIARSEVLRSSTDSIKVVALLGVLAVLLCIFIQRLMAQRITRPLDDMVKSILGANTGDYSNKVSVNTGDEMEVLASTYNNLMKKTDTLVNQVLKGEIEYRNAQIQALQSQINPHLMFNTFECINWLAEYGRKDDIRRVTTSFSKIMKAMMSGPKMVPLREELDLVEDFLLIYKILLMDRLEYTIDVSDVPGDFPVPRLTIQPIVENAVVHGIKKSMTGGNINIIAAPSQDGITITVIDDGVGMAEEYVNAVNAYSAGVASEKQASSIGIGFKNIMERLRLIYGDEPHLFASSSPDWGTTVRIQIPEEGEDEE